LKLLRFLATLLLALAGLALTPPVGAEYGDVVINNYSDAAGMRPVVFPHWFHRVRFRCKVCHADLGFQFGFQGRVEFQLAGQFVEVGALHKVFFVDQQHAGHDAQNQRPQPAQ